jgi:hypothetical protein
MPHRAHPTHRGTCCGGWPSPRPARPARARVVEIDKILHAGFAWMPHTPPAWPCRADTVVILAQLLTRHFGLAPGLSLSEALWGYLRRWMLPGVMS